VALLYSQLPQNSRTVKKKQPANEWDNTDYLLWLIEYDLRILHWSLIDEKARRGHQQPRPLPTPQEHAHNEEKKINAQRDKAEIDKLLGIEG
jgi:hypothetical protein